MRYSKNFNRDFSWYLSVRSIFQFSGSNDKEVIKDNNGVSGKKAFFLYDSQGKLVPTKHPKLLSTLIRTKASVNLHRKLYKEDIDAGLYPRIEFRAFCISIRAPHWFSKNM